MVGDFFVGQALGDERNELLLAAAEAQAPAVAAAGKRRRIALEVAEQDSAKRARANRLAGMHGLYALENFVGGSIAQQVTVDPRAHTLQKFALVFGHPDEQNAHVGRGGTHFLYGSQVFNETAARTQQQNIRTSLEEGIGMKWGRGVCVDDFKAGAPGQNASQRLAQQAI